MTELTPMETLTIVVGLLAGFAALFGLLQALADFLEKHFPFEDAE